MGVGLAIASGSVLVAALIAAVSRRSTLTAAIRERRSVSAADVRRARTIATARGTRHADGGAPLQRARRRCANREYRALVGLAVAVLLLALKATYNGVFWRAARAGCSVS